MRFSLSLFNALAAVAAAENYLGFNSGSTKADYSVKVKADFLQEFKTAQNLQGAPGVFNAVRLYTNIQGGTTDDPISAFEAAMETKTKILLGVWTSGTTSIEKELNALSKAVKQYGSNFTDLVIGISIGSEDLYRNSVTGVTNKAGVGAQPSQLVGFISDFKKTFKDTALGKTPVGHVDTWDVWGNATNKAVLDAIDWVGVDEYPYYENGKGNDIKNSGNLFDKAYNATIQAVGGKAVWVTETGWPTSGIDWDQAVPSIDNAKYYWQEIGCRVLFNKVPTFWYNLRDSNPDNKQQFAITKDLSTTPLFDLKCPTTFDTDKQRQSSSGSNNSSSTSGSGSNSTGGSNSSTPSSSSGSSSSGSNSSPSAGTTSKAPSSAAGVIEVLPVAAYAGLAVIGGALAMY
ncbi:hypothetical protein MCOR25_005896 [Pyricularia grisea]|uniref:Uncharacterized protein n=1 Tax=Pyricularia grisea TaxID=148305 RepID=A0A6P8B9F8_PYRGI|nr:uncharacterized protein PgNI_02904 [Pyricularia grisea]KAI6363538.1 hypothetical protein MCOR25_005896 [Pyricularia grisea]TLD12464.1 hypothetical protein PgNI_02904 [Pyricularia grisea]